MRCVFHPAPTRRIVAPAAASAALWLPPAAGISQMFDALRFASLSGVATVNATHFPSGDICGSLTRCMEIKSSNVIARFDCAPARGAHITNARMSVALTNIALRFMVEESPD